ncbi:MAG: glycosyltransferase, partial [Bacteroidota bacterium]
DMEQEVYTAKHWAGLEDKVIQNADVTLVTSRQLRELKVKHNPNTYILHNAVDKTIFKRAISERHARPSEIAHIQTPIIGFTGNMDASRMDYQLLKMIALHHQDKTLVLVGPVNSAEFYDLGLDKMPNVITTGSKNINDLPKYLQHFDCTIIPFLCNTLTASIYPLKINEYLFSGKPVISTSFSVDIRSFGEVIYLANDHAHFNQLIEQALAEDDLQRKDARIAVARTNTWEHRVKEFWQIVEQHLITV